MKILHARKGENIRFIYESLQMLDYVVGGHERHWISKFIHLEIQMPSQAEQEKIAHFLTAIDDKIAQTGEIQSQYLVDFQAFICFFARIIYGF